jgi:hypothetical protein
MSDSSHEIAIVFDPEFGSRLPELADSVYTWVVQSPENERAFKEYKPQYRGEFDEDLLSSGMTMFQSDLRMDANFMDLIWDHHGDFAHTPALSKLRVIGLQATPDILEALATYDFSVIESNTDAFTALRKNSSQGAQ